MRVVAAYPGGSQDIPESKNRIEGFTKTLKEQYGLEIVSSIEELRDGERDVNSLQEALGISHSGVSQHLMVMRANRLVSERRQGRRVFYHLRQPQIAGWLLEATRFLLQETAAADELRKAIGKTRKDWAGH